jgi:outer membrane protein TolC
MALTAPRCSLLVASLAAVVFSGSPALAAEQADDAFLRALASAPAVAAARTRSVSAERVVEAADVLPDPMIEVEAGRSRSRPDGGMTMYGTAIEQPLPRWGERGARRQGALAQALAMRAEFAGLVGEHAAAVAAALAEREAAEQGLALTRESRARLDAFAAVVHARIASGAGRLDEQLDLDTRRQQWNLTEAEQLRRRDDAEAEVRGRLGLAPDAPLPPLALPEVAAIRPESAPMARRAEAGRAEAEAAEREAQARANPETALGLAWEREAAGTEQQVDTWKLSFRLSLPVWRSAYAAEADAARGRARAASHEARASVWMAHSQISRARRAAEQSARAEALAEDIVARNLASYDSVVSLVGSGGAPITAALDLLDRISEARAQAIEARLACRLASAELWRLSPPELPVVDSQAEHQMSGMNAP